MSSDESSQPPFPPPIPHVVDWDLALEAVAGDRKLLQDVVELFLKQGPLHMKAIRAALDKVDHKALHIAAHTLKGETRYFGADRLEDTALALEMMARAANPGEPLEGAEPIVERLTVQFAELVEALQVFVK